MANHWTVFNSAGAVICDNVSQDVAEDYLTPERAERGWRAVYCLVVRNPAEFPVSPAMVEVSTAREYQPEEDGAPGDGPAPADGNLQTAIEEALASLECGMVEGAALTLRDAISPRFAPSARADG